MAGMGDVVQVEVQLGEEELSMKPEGPKNNSVVEFAFEAVDRVLEVNIWGVDVVGDVSLK